jgi:SM-20-related protein
LRGASHAEDVEGDVMPDPTRSERVAGRDVFVFDELVPPEEAARYFTAISQAAFTRTESARGDTGEFRHWVCEMPLANLPRTSLWAATERAVTAVRPGERFLPYRVYTNFSQFGDTLLTHVDAVGGARELTALWFLCERWDTEWGGETLFYDDAGDARVAVSPRPGRLLLFDGAIRHAGKPPNRNCLIARYTFAIKLRAA